jgi:hypothetical protein
MLALTDMRASKSVEHVAEVMSRQINNFAATFEEYASNSCPAVA